MRLPPLAPPRARPYLARFDARSGELTGPPTLWGEDFRFLDTPGWSNRLSHDGGIIYSEALAAEDVRYFRVMPDFARRVREAIAVGER